MEWNKIQQKTLLGLLIAHGIYRWLSIGYQDKNTTEPLVIDRLESMAWVDELPPPYPFTRNQHGSKEFRTLSRKSTHWPRQSFWGDTVQESTWQSWGCSPKQAAAIHRIITQRKRPWQKEDLATCKFVPETLREHLLPFWMAREIPDGNRPSAIVQKRPLVDINLADSMSLLEVPGIGPFLAGKILETRRLAGGFHAVRQLRWFYGMRLGKCDTLATFLTASPVSLKTFSFAYGGREEYFKIPGLRKKTVYQIIDYRNRHGPFSSPEDWVKHGFISDTLLNDIRPYLSFP